MKYDFLIFFPQPFKNVKTILSSWLAQQNRQGARFGHSSLPTTNLKCVAHGGALWIGVHTHFQFKVLKIHVFQSKALECQPSRLALLRTLKNRQREECYAHFRDAEMEAQKFRELSKFTDSKCQNWRL